MTKIRTFDVLAGAYKSEAALKNLKTHACEVDEQGAPIRVLCSRVKLESLLEDPGQATDEPPTCGICAARAEKIKSKE